MNLTPKPVTNLSSTGVLGDIISNAIEPALKLLPPKMDSPNARIMLLACGLQESRFLYRRQLGDGPARGFWQFEQGTKTSRGGVWGVYLHHATSELLRLLCRERNVSFDPKSIWAQLEHDDILAAGVARLLLWTHAKPLPQIGNDAETWDYYYSLWRPGAPKPDTWPRLYAQAMRQVLGTSTADS